MAVGNYSEFYRHDRLVHAVTELFWTIATRIRPARLIRQHQAPVAVEVPAHVSRKERNAARGDLYGLRFEFNDRSIDIVFRCLDGQPTGRTSLYCKDFSLL